MSPFRDNQRQTLPLIHRMDLAAISTTQSLGKCNHRPFHVIGYQDYKSTFVTDALYSFYSLTRFTNRKQNRKALEALRNNRISKSYRVTVSASKQNKSRMLLQHILQKHSRPPVPQSKIFALIPFLSTSRALLRDSALQFARHCHHKTPECGFHLKIPHKELKSSLDGTSNQLTHTDAQGKASMVNVGAKPVTHRTATACGKVILGPKAFNLVCANQVAKGDALAVAQLAGIMGAKQTSNLIPLCHPLPLDHASVTIELLEEEHAAVIKATCQTTGRTGVEMEALTAVSIASLTLYDMCKSVSHDIIITDIKLLSKTGGQRGDFHL